MVTKLLFTVFVVIGVLVYFRRRAGRRPRYAYPPPVMAKAPGPGIRWAAYGVIGIMALGSAGYVYLRWSESRRVVQVRVVNTNTGMVTSFRAYQGQVDLKAGRFTTIEGEEVHPATVERLELVPE